MTCNHTEHAIRPGTGVVGRYFEKLDSIGKWELCQQETDSHYSYLEEDLNE